MQCQVADGTVHHPLSKQAAAAHTCDTLTCHTDSVGIRRNWFVRPLAVALLQGFGKGSKAYGRGIPLIGVLTPSKEFLHWVHVYA